MLDNIGEWLQHDGKWVLDHHSYVGMCKMDNQDGKYDEFRGEEDNKLKMYGHRRMTIRW
jgi:hypothetical protein